MSALVGKLIILFVMLGAASGCKKGGYFFFGPIYTSNYSYFFPSAAPYKCYKGSNMDVDEEPEEEVEGCKACGKLVVFGESLFHDCTLQAREEHQAILTRQ